MVGALDKSSVWNTEKNYILCHVRKVVCKVGSEDHENNEDCSEKSEKRNSKIPNKLNKEPKIKKEAKTVYGQDGKPKVLSVYK